MKLKQNFKIFNVRLFNIQLLKYRIPILGELQKFINSVSCHGFGKQIIFTFSKKLYVVSNN